MGGLRLSQHMTVAIFPQDGSEESSPRESSRTANQAGQVTSAAVARCECGKVVYGTVGEFVEWVFSRVGEFAGGRGAFVEWIGVEWIGVESGAGTNGKDGAYTTEMSPVCAFDCAICTYSGAACGECSHTAPSASRPH
jgi:hypothetical protein